MSFNYYWKLLSLLLKIILISYINIKYYININVYYYYLHVRENLNVYFFQIAATNNIKRKVSKEK